MSFLLICSLLFLLVHFFRSYTKASLRESFVYSLIALFVVVYLFIEGVSLFHQLTRTTALLFTLFFLLVLILAWSWRKKTFLQPPATNSRPRYSFPLPLSFSVFLSVIFMEALFLAGSYFPPNNWDSLASYLVKIGFWIQNQSVAFFPTNNPIQLYTGPLAQYFLTYIFFIDHHDAFFFLGQWFALLGSACCVSLIVKNVFQKDTPVQHTAFLTTILVPMSLLQASSTQTDLVVSFFILAFFLFYFSTNNRTVIFITFSLAVLVKTTAFLYLGIPLLFLLLKDIHRKKFWSVILFMVVFLVFNGPHHWRNYTTFGSPFGPEGSDYRIETLQPPFIIVNALKNVSLHFIFHSDAWNTGLLQAVNTTAKWLHVPLDAPEISYRGASYETEKVPYDQDYGTGSFFFLFVVGAVVFFFTRVRSDLQQQKYVFFQILGFLLIVGVLKYQPWAIRLHLPILLALVPVISLWFAQVPKLAFFIQAYMVIFGVSVLLYNANKPFAEFRDYTERDEIRFIKKPYLYTEYQVVTQYISSQELNNIAVMSNGDWEYPLWYFLYRSVDRLVYTHVFVQNHTNEGIFPEVIIDIREDGEHGETLFLNGSLYPKIIDLDVLDVYRKQ